MILYVTDRSAKTTFETIIILKRNVNKSLLLFSFLRHLWLFSLINREQTPQVVHAPMFIL